MVLKDYGVSGAGTKLSTKVTGIEVPENLNNSLLRLAGRWPRVICQSISDRRLYSNIGEITFLYVSLVGLYLKIE